MKDLDETLKSEAPGILCWLVDGCLEWQRDGLLEPEAVIRETLAYRKSEDTFSRFASDNNLNFGPGLKIQSGRLQDMLTDWAQSEGIDPPRRDLVEWLKENGARNKQRRVDEDGERKRRRFWIGIGLGDEEIEETPFDESGLTTPLSHPSRGFPY